MTILYDADFAERIYAKKGHSGIEIQISQAISEPVLAQCVLLLILILYINFVRAGVHYRQA
jgi:hypothetical protein